ncbi:hypothetical protein THAOC_26890 [Thalassiosira oceanica]|uniref:Uncharacterized protein n=1 Tax=Thalassiosira oceanica TaxID=159749 RepID=K0RIW0_THAOC|nr:hypothetical protein THAOC_26890 [Thalassiosira oceanica]|eukprot:EJK53633.1 hypothetical protein THAOC_26890 [Thalassiosira oceanica]
MFIAPKFQPYYSSAVSNTILSSLYAVCAFGTRNYSESDLDTIPTSAEVLFRSASGPAHMRFIPPPMSELDAGTQASMSQRLIGTKAKQAGSSSAVSVFQVSVLDSFTSRSLCSTAPTRPPTQRRYGFQVRRCATARPATSRLSMAPRPSLIEAKTVEETSPAVSPIFGPPVRPCWGSAAHQHCDARLCVRVIVSESRPARAGGPRGRRAGADGEDGSFYGPVSNSREH